MSNEPSSGLISAGQLGSPVFRERHRLKYAYVAGSMFKGIGSKELVERMGKAGLIGYLGTGGMKLDRIETELQYLQSRLTRAEVYGLNLLASPFKPDLERATVDLFLKYCVPRVEAAAFTEVTIDLARYRISGIVRRPDGSIHIPHSVLAKVSRPEVAERFLSPAPTLVHRLLESRAISPQEASLAPHISMADDICVEADSAGHTDRGVAYALVPAISRLRDEISARHQYSYRITVGAAGGLGTPEAIAASFVLGADFVLTGSVNQCTVEAGTSEPVKDMLQGANVQDMDIVPAGDMFEMGAKVQVFKKGLLFPARAKKLYDLYRQYNSIEEIDEKTRQQIETRYFKRTFAEVYAETKAYYQKAFPEALERAERDPRQKMALIFRWYFVHAHRLAAKGDPDNKVDYQIHCGPALGSFNQWVRGTQYESWRSRHVDKIAEMLMEGAATVLNDRFHQWHRTESPRSG